MSFARASKGTLCPLKTRNKPRIGSGLRRFNEIDNFDLSGWQTLLRLYSSVFCCNDLIRHVRMMTETKANSVAAWFNKLHLCHVHLPQTTTKSTDDPCPLHITFLLFCTVSFELWASNIQYPFPHQTHWTLPSHWHTCLANQIAEVLFGVSHLTICVNILHSALFCPRMGFGQDTQATRHSWRSCRSFQRQKEIALFLTKPYHSALKFPRNVDYN